MKRRFILVELIMYVKMKKCFVLVELTVHVKWKDALF